MQYQHGLFLGLEWMSFDAIKRELNLWKEATEANPDLSEIEYKSIPDFSEIEYKSIPGNAVAKRYMDPDNWVGLATDGCGNSIGVDLKPGPSGKVGQVIVWGRDCFDNRVVLFDCLSDFLKTVVEKLEDKTFFTVDKQYEIYDLGPNINFIDYLLEKKLKVFGIPE